MKVGYDSGTSRNAFGTGTYASRLLEALAGKVDAVGFDYDEFRRTMGFGAKLRKHASRISNRTSGDVHWEWNVVPELGRKAGIDAYHALGSCVPLSAPFKRVMTVHDLAFYHHPEYMDAPTLRFYKGFYRRSAQSADAVLAISDATKKDMMKFWDVPADRIHVVHHGVGKEFFERKAEAEISAALKKNGISGRYYLAVGELNHRKNLHTLIRAFTKCPSDMKLVLCGKAQKGGYSGSLEKIASELGVLGRVAFTGRVSFDEMRCLYQRASAFVFPSLYEGFGLPILEAQASGAPVVCSDNSSLPEVAGDGALLVPATDVDKMAEAMAKALEDKARTALVDKGFENARRFTWERTADGTVAVYNRVTEKL